MYFLVIKNPFLGGHLFKIYHPLRIILGPLVRIDIWIHRGWWETSNSYSLPTEPRGSPGPSHQEWDKDKDGRLDYREFAAIFQYLGVYN